MKPVVALAVTAAVLAAVTLGGARLRSGAIRAPAGTATPRAEDSPCPPRSLPDHGVCVPVPAPLVNADAGSAAGNPDRDAN